MLRDDLYAVLPADELSPVGRKGQAFPARERDPWGRARAGMGRVLPVVPLLGTALGHLRTRAGLLPRGRRGCQCLCVHPGSLVLVCHHHTPLLLQGAASISMALGSGGGPGAPAEPVSVGTGAAALPQPGASLTFLKRTDCPCTCARWVTLSAYKMQEKLGIFVSVLHRQGREVSAWDGARLGCQGHRQLRGGKRQKGKVKRGTEAGVRGTLVTPLCAGRGRRTGAFHRPVQILLPCRLLQQLHAVAWLLQLYHGCSSCATASLPGPDSHAAPVPASAQAAAGQGRIPVPRSSTEEAVQRGQAPAEPQGLSRRRWGLLQGTATALPAAMSPQVLPPARRGTSRSPRQAEPRLCQ